MTTVTVSETDFNVTVSDTANTVSVSTGGDISVAVNTQVFSTAIANSGTSGVKVLKSISGDTLTARRIKTTGNDISLSELTDDIDITLNDTITVNVTGDLTGNLLGNTTIAGSLIPTTDDAVDLGSTTKRFRDLYLGPGSLFVNNQKVLEDDSGTIKVSSTNNLSIQSGGDLTLLSSNGTSVIQDATVNVGPADNSGTTNIRGTLDVVTKIEMGDLDIISGQIHQDSSNGNLTIKTNGTGFIHANTADFYVGAGDPASAEFVKIDENTITKVGGGSLTYTGSVVGNVTGTVSDISNHLLDEDDMSTDSNTKAPSQQSVKAFVASQILTKDNSDEITEGSTNLYFTNARARGAISENSTQLAYNNSTGVLTYTQGDTDTVSEGSSNQYFTTARARASISASGSLAYNSGTGALSYTQGNTDTVSEGSSNLYFTNSRADGRVTNAIIDEDDFSSNSDTKVPTQQSTKAYIATQIATKDNSDELTEGSTNLYFTDARARGAISENSTQLAYNSSTGVLTYTQGNTDTVAEGSSNLYHTSARAISAVEGESTLALSGAVTTTGQLTVNDVIKVDDGFILTAFNPYGAGANMPTRIMGIGEEGGWAGLHVRNRGAHDFGIGSQFNFSPRALAVLSAGRIDSGSDDYLDSGDEFGVLSFNPYTDYKTGAEWLTGSAEISAIATENHSATGLGTKLRIRTTEDGEEASAQESTHTNKFIDIQGHTITTDGTLKINDDLIITGSISNDTSNTPVTVGDNLKVNGATSNNTEIGDNTVTSNNYNVHGIKVQADDTKWGAYLIKEYVGAGNKPAVSGFTNPTFGTEIVGGTPTSESAVVSGKRTFVLQSIAANASDGTLPGVAGAMIKFETTQDQTTSNMGHKVAIESIANDANTRSSSIIAQGGSIVFHAEGDATLSSGGDLILNDDVKVTGTIDLQSTISNSTGDVTVGDNFKTTGNLTVDGNTQLGNANTDTVTCTAKLTAVNGFVNTTLDTATANTLAGLGAIDEGASAYITDGNAGSKCMAFFDGTNWKKMHSPGDNIASS